MSRLVPEPPAAGRVLDARLHLLDRQVLDADGEPVCTLDDLELDVAGPDAAGADAAGADHAAGERAHPTGRSTLVVTALLTGPVLGTRLFGGRPPSSRWQRVLWRHVTDVGAAVRIGVRGDELEATWRERWLRERVVGRIPGRAHDPEAGS